MSTPTFNSRGKQISCEVFQPVGGGKQPAIVVAYGTAGMTDPYGKDIQSFAGDLAGKGYVVLIPYYFGETKPGLPALDAFVTQRDIWVERLGDALSFAAGRADVKGDKIGLLGFSMGGHLALRRAKAGAGVKVGAVVEFFAPISGPPPFNGLGGDIEKLPPTQIHHGDSKNDTTVPPQQSDELERLLLKAGKKKGSDYERHDYPGEGHSFKDAVAIRTSRQRTADFFDKHLR